MELLLTIGTLARISLHRERVLWALQALPVSEEFTLLANFVAQKY
jgi:hypothetical protein